MKRNTILTLAAGLILGIGATFAVLLLLQPASNQSPVREAAPTTVVALAATSTPLVEVSLTLTLSAVATSLSTQLAVLSATMEAQTTSATPRLGMPDGNQVSEAARNMRQLSNYATTFTSIGTDKDIVLSFEVNGSRYRGQGDFSSGRWEYIGEGYHVWFRSKQNTWLEDRGQTALKDAIDRALAAFEQVENDALLATYEGEQMLDGRLVNHYLIGSPEKGRSFELWVDVKVVGGPLVRKLILKNADVGGSGTTFVQTYDRFGQIPAIELPSASYLLPTATTIEDELTAAEGLDLLIEAGTSMRTATYLWDARATIDGSTFIANGEYGKASSIVDLTYKGTMVKIRLDEGSTYRSTDGGNTWQDISTSSLRDGIDLMISTFDEPFLSQSDPDLKVEVRGREQVDGVATIKVRTTRLVSGTYAGTYTTDYWVDAVASSNGRWVRRYHSEQDGAGGRSIIDISYSGFSPQARLQQPASTVTQPSPASTLAAKQSTPVAPVAPLDLPAMAIIAKVAMVSPDEGWAVGSLGEQDYKRQGSLILHYTAGQWQQVPSPTEQPLYGIFMLSRSEGWAVGGGGTILHYTAGDWVRFSSPSRGELTAIHMTSPDDGWIVGEYTLPLHYQAGRWTELGTDDSPMAKQRLSALVMFNQNEGWTLGDNGYMSEHSDILHYQNGSWAVNSGETYPGLTAVDMVSPNEGWAVGLSIVHYLKGRWTELGQPVAGLGQATLPYIRAIDMVTANSGWAVGNRGVILHYQDGVWSVVATPTDKDLYSIQMTSTEDGWAAGAAGVILHYHGGKWSKVAGPEMSLSLTSVDMVSANEGWAVGENGTILHYKAGKWEREFGPDPLIGLNKVFMFSNKDGWAVGNDGVILHYQVGKWQRAVSPARENLLSLYLTSANEGWAVGGSYGEGNSHVVLRYDGHSWREFGVSGFEYVFAQAVRMSSAKEGWAVGRHLIARYEDAGWEVLTPAFEGDLRAVYLFSSTEGWAVGGEVTDYTTKTSKSLIVRLRNGTWQEVPSPTNQVLNAVSTHSRDDGWAVGDGGTILRYQAGRWQSVNSPTRENLKSVYMTSTDEGWAVGGEVILHYQNGVWQPYDL